MLRILMVAFAALVTAACTVGLPSSIEAAPFADRMRTPPFAAGVYCGLGKAEEGGLLVKSGAGDGENNCATFRWDGARRVFRIEDPTGEASPMDLALANMGGGLFLMQFPNPEKDAPFPYLFMAGVAHGEAVAVLPLPSDIRVSEVARRHPRVKLSAHHSSNPLLSFTDEAVGGGRTEPVPVPNPDIYYVSGGSPADVRRLVRDVAIDLIGEMAGKAGETGLRIEDGVPTIVRDRAGADDHALSAAQRRDVDALTTKLRALVPPP